MKNTRKCKECKEEFVPYNSLQKYCFKPECTKVFVEIEKAKQWRKTKAVKKEELMTLQDWLKIAQFHFNHYIRLRDKGRKCISCQKKALKENCGHFFSQGGHSNVRFDEVNCWLQCEHCNSYKSGNLIEYRKHLISEIGEEEFDKLSDRANITKKWTLDEVKEIISTYKLKIKELKSKIRKQT